MITDIYKDYTLKTVDTMNYGLSGVLNDYELNIKDIISKLQLIKMFKFVNENNCCSCQIRCNFNYEEEIKRYLITLGYKYSNPCNNC
jgi:hypothetical protein